MGRKRSPGLRQRAETLHIEKHFFGQTMHESSRTSDLEAAELTLARRLEEVLLGHRYGDITTHYSAPEPEELVNTVNRVCGAMTGKIYGTGSPEPIKQ